MRQFNEIIHRKLTVTLPRMLAVFIALSIMFLFYFGVNYFTHFVKITDSDGLEFYAFAPIATHDYVLEINDTYYIGHDDIHYDINKNELSTIFIDRAYPIEITADGKTSEYLTTAKTVEIALEEAGYTWASEDYSSPSFDKAIDENTGEIQLYRVTYEVYDVDEVLPYETEMQYTSLFYLRGHQDIVLEIQTGVDGYINATYQDKLIDGEVVETTTISTNEHIEPITEILKVYKEYEPISAVEAPEGITVDNFVPSSYSTVYQMKATGYYSATGRGSSGLGLYYGTFAVDPTVIPYGTKVYIVSTDNRFVYGWAIATDTGAFIHSNQMQVDLFYETYAESAINGVQQVYVYVP